ncbi:MAG: hypothetical protein AB7P19_15185 [Nitrospira sp.]
MRIWRLSRGEVRRASPTEGFNEGADNMAKNRQTPGTPRGAASWEQTEQLETVGDVKRFLACLIQQVRRNKVSVKKANCLGQLCNVMISAIVDYELEERIATLERRRASGQLPQPGATAIHARGSA